MEHKTVAERSINKNGNHCGIVYRKNNHTTAIIEK